MASVYVTKIVTVIESSKERTIMVARSRLTETDMKLIRSFANDNNKEVKFATMQEICFCKDKNILVIE
jgi:DNA-binding Xre family transcriptional regulator